MPTELQAREKKKAEKCGILRVWLWHMRRSDRISDKSKIPPADKLPSVVSLNAKALGGKVITHATG